jgi:hypothetical protein
MPITETFDEAVSKFIAFLERQNSPVDLRWLCREEVTGYRRQLFVHPSPSPDNRELYRHKYSHGVTIGHSVALAATCFADGVTYCNVWVSAFDFDSTHPELTGDLHFHLYVDSSTSQPNLSARRSCSAFTFHIRRAWCRVRGESPAVGEFSTRSELESLSTNTRNA